MGKVEASPPAFSSFWFGPGVRGGETEFRLWAPTKRSVEVEIAGAQTLAMTSDDSGWRRANAKRGAGSRYAFRIERQIRVPDPASRLQAGDVADFSIVTDPNAYRWLSANWKGRPWEETIIYELHVGLFGGFAGVAAHLARIAGLGFTAIELMPIGDFPGARNWGYDGVLPFAPDCAYGSPTDLKSLIDKAHASGLMVFLDVVYNHFGPDGNRIGEYAPQFFRSDDKTPWGTTIDFREPMVRRFFIENALYWIDEFRFDGLRLDAVHAIRDNEFLALLAAEVRRSVEPDRHVHLVVENDDNDAALLRDGFVAQWNDDLHHALHVLLTGETQGYYADYAQEPAVALARALGEGFVYQGEASPHRGGKARGTPSIDLAPTSFVAFLQNHDQIGNRAFGERLTTLATPDALRAAIALLLLSPQIPLVFMGEEAGAMEPFLYFTDHNPGLAPKVREGRRNEFANFPEFSDPKTLARIPDPNAVETFESSRPSLDGPRAEEWNSLYRALLSVRRKQIVPRLANTCATSARAVGEAAIVARWRLGDGAKLVIGTNLGPRSVHAELPRTAPVWGAAADELPPETTLAWIET
ncbi:MAG TPA: malto-oligosyltrehalose trehalohydrolase [Rhizomicrobium sp.]|jgi:maltooligosyltrehalose trehalohydrolase|nr:malto-oligosyltrehalose trehalohydrolase [Rhizomicrobium sp.]